MSKQKVALAELLLRRKELEGKVKVLANIRKEATFEVKTARKSAHEGIDDVIASVPKLTASQLTAEFDFAARQLRLVDAHIQRANWETQVEVDDNVMADYVAPVLTPPIAQKPANS